MTVIAQRTHKWTRRLAPWIAPAMLVVVWELLCRCGVILPSLLPAPFDVVLAAERGFRQGSLGKHLGVSALRALDRKSVV